MERFASCLLNESGVDYHFEQVDVFTRERFAGNPLAVFPDAQGLSASQMHAIAREMNLSETTFVVPPTRPDCVARYIIYTPDWEMPFAGHPTIGTAYVLARRGAAADGRVLHLQAKVGKIAVRFEGPHDDPSALFFTSPPVEFGKRCEDRAGIAESLGLRESDLMPNAPIEEAGCPVLYPYVGLATPQLVDAVTVNAPLFVKSVDDATIDGVYVFAWAGDAKVYSRFFVFTRAGTLEDPATGSAASPLGAYLFRHGLIGGAGKIEFDVEQGTKMGRQSFLAVSVMHRGSTIEAIEVGGSAVPVLSGTLRL